jgi:hypothetical protein
VIADLSHDPHWFVAQAAGTAAVDRLAGQPTPGN